MEASPPGAGPRRPSSTPGVGPTAEAGGDPATAVGAPGRGGAGSGGLRHEPVDVPADRRRHPSPRSEEHTSELQSHSDLVCRLLLEKKKKTERRNNREFT